jgi:hypothetical protein
MIKPAFFKHAELFAAERDSALPLRIAFAGLWTVADKEGRFKWKPDLKPDVLPYDDVDMLDVLGALERAGFIHRYVVDGKDYGLIPSFREHQTFHKSERGSTIPPPPDNGRSTVKAPVSNGGSTVRPTSDTVAVAVAVTGTVADAVAADGALPPAAAAADVPEPTIDYLVRCVRALNNGMRANTAVRAAREIPSTSQSGVVDWEKKGVPIEFAEAIIAEKCAAFRPGGRDRQISGLRYFDATVEERWENHNKPTSPATPTSDPRLCSDRARVILALAKQYGLLRWIGSETAYQQAVDRAAADPRAGPAFRDEVQRLNLTNGIGDQTHERFAIAEIARRLSVPAA